MLGLIVKRNAIEFEPFFSRASLFCVLAEEIHCAAGHPEKEGAPSRCLQMPLLSLGVLNGVNSVGNSHTQAKQYPWAALKIKKLGMGWLGHNYKCCFIVLDMHMVGCEHF